jgi:hypothetical protein
VHEAKMDRFAVPLILWLVGGNLIVLLSLKRQGLSWKHMFTPNVLSKLQGQDWLRILALLIVTMALVILAKWEE